MPIPVPELSSIRAAVSGAIQLAVKTLLESKHLYQSINVEVERIKHDHLKGLRSGSDNIALTSHFAEAAGWPWLLLTPHVEDQFGSIGKSTYPSDFEWTAPAGLKLYCAKGKRLEAHNFDCSHNLLPHARSELTGGQSEFFHNKNRVQVFALAYQCQACRDIPELFLIRRSGSKLQLTGRTPMEAVIPADHLPARIARHMTDAQLAFQSGQTLPAIFMLRVACEQWVRPYAPQGERLDDAFEAYSGALPEDFRKRFPSLKSVYGELTAAVHEANAEESIYLTKKDDIEMHFRARPLYNDIQPDPSDDRA